MANSIPVAVADVFDTRILIMMPDPMTYDESIQPSVKVLDSYVEGATIQRVIFDDDFDGCSTRVCYSVRHTTTAIIPGDSRLRFQIRGTIN